MITENEYHRYLNAIIEDSPLSESTQAGLRCGGKTGLAMAQAQREFMDNWDKLNLKFSGGIKKGELVFIGGGRSQGKSYFQDVFLQSNESVPLNYDWVILDDWQYQSHTGYTLMKTKSKQSRYVRVWRNKQ